MKNIRKYILAAIALMLCTTLSAQDKVVESSTKKAPSWIGLADKDFFTVSVSGASIDEAQRKAMDQIRQQIITSVASNISSTETMFTQQDTRNKLVDLLEQYSSSVKTQGAQMPFLTNISISQAEDIYWEKRYVKNSKSYYYLYNVKYPFPEKERKALVDEFLRIDQGYYNRFLELKRNLDTFTSVEYIDRAIGELAPLIAYFFDDARKNDAKALQTSYRRQYDNITIMPTANALGHYDYCLMLAGRKVTTPKQPNVKSNCASSISVTPSADGYSVKYDYSDCRDDEDNWIEVVYTLGGRTLRQRIPYDIRQEKMLVIPYGQVIVAPRETADSASAGKVTVTLQLRSKYDNPFIVENVSIYIPEFRDQIVSPALNNEFTGKGMHTLTFECDTPVKQERGDNHTALTRGTMQLKNSKKGPSQTILVQLPYVIR